MKGYRTIIFSALMTLTGMVGWKVSPGTANSWVDIFFAVWGIGAILLRQITTTPVGNPAAVPVAANLLTSDDVTGLRQNMQTIFNHVSMMPVLAQAIDKSLQKFDEIIGALQMVVAGAASANGSVAPQGDPVVPAQTSDGGALAPSSIAPAQPVMPSAPIAAPSQEPAPAVEPQASVAQASAPVILPVS